MQATQVKALSITVLIFAVVAYFLVLKPLGYTVGDLGISSIKMPEIDLPEIKMPEFGGGGSATKPQKARSTKKTTIAPKNRNSVASKIFDKTTNFDTPIDVHNGVGIYFNGQVKNVHGRHVTKDGYNLGLKYQCVEFVKRYYYEHLNHKMPDSYGHARDFFNRNLYNGQYNRTRGLSQYINGAGHKPMPDDLIIYAPNQYNPYGHVAIVAHVSSNEVHIVQQNPGPNNPSRDSYPLEKVNDRWKVLHKDIVGWLRKD